MRVLPHACADLSRAPHARRMAVAARLAAAVAAIAVTAAACGGTPADGVPAAAGASSPAAPSGTAVRLDRPLPKPGLTLTDDRGRPFDLVEQTAGRPTLVYFGYTHCPDVCPTTMADIANAVKKLPEADQERLRVVFVTTDPARDTPQRLHRWLAAFDSRFIGLSGDFDAIQRAARGLGILVEKPVKEADGGYTVNHGAQVLAFSPADDGAHTIYTSGTTSQQYEADLPKLVEGAR
ncbi:MULTISPECIES: SCO family protein [unclassified Spirillospora]|uniref:SCO family protein n=1 Tax=unclassified Spirillospora TaxID=2642701 RepID=UPI00371D7CC3